MKIKSGYLLALAGAAALSACNTYADPAVESPAVIAAIPGMPVTQEAFVHMAAANSAYEIRAAQIAQQMSQDPQVRAFAQKMLDDHTMATQTLQRAAAQARVPIDRAMTAEQEANLNALRNAGANFDMLYKQQMAMTHERAVGLLQMGTQMTDWEALQEWSRMNLPVIENHLVLARQLP